uniref:Ig-like domain-containing protein n=1 Tax=Cyprinus carpio carpio TaxID=630221 RepID=A0A8C0YCX7_CYPCA
MITPMLLKLFIFASVYHEYHGEEIVDQPDKHITEFEGKTVTLQCKFKTASSQPDHFWYIQRANDFPKYMLRRNKYGSEDNDAQFKERFDSKVSSDSVPLMIKNLRVSDSAVYYCALRSTVTETHSTLKQKQRKCSVI